LEGQLSGFPKKKQSRKVEVAGQPDDPVNTIGASLIVDLDDTNGLKTLKECIARSGASSPQFARMMGVDRSTMSLWLSGKRPVTGTAIRAALFCAAMSGVPMRMPNPSQYLSRG
jgi:hypothetical protein